MENNEKIDIVVSWLDDNDPIWQAEFNKYSDNPSFDVGANNNARFRDYDLFKYWFRGIDKYAPWVNKIHIVTFGHIPGWLDTNNSKINIVKHTDFIPSEYLPTFSSDTIALNLHRIPNLQEYFVYFNDDMYMINPTTATDFFKNGKPCDFFTLIPAGSSETFNHYAINNMILIHREFSKKQIIDNNKRKMFCFHTSMKSLVSNLLQLPYGYISDILHYHLTTPLTRTLYLELWDKHSIEFNKTSKNKFRDISDVTDWYIRMYYLANGNYHPKNMDKFGHYYSIKDIENIDRILSSKYKIICLNDDISLDEVSFNNKKNILLEGFEKKFPDCSIFEK